MAKRQTGYRWIDHTADAAAALRGETLEALFETAAGALTDLITDRGTIRERAEEVFALRAPDREQLLVRWLNELIARFEIEGLVFRRFSVERVGEEDLVARAFGEMHDHARHPFRKAVKAATYHGLALERVPDGWKATVIFDI